MNIGSFFISLGVKGATQTARSLNTVKSGLGETARQGLIMKAAVVGALWAVERMTRGASNMGTSLTHFAKSTGMSAVELQRWQHAGRQYGITAEEVQQSIMGVNDAMYKMISGQGAPKGYADFVNSIKDFDQTKATDTLYVMKKLQEYAQKSPMNSMKRDFLGSFGLGGSTIAGMVDNVFNEKALASANVLTDRQSKNLLKVGAGWDQIGHNIKMAMAGLASKDGFKLIKDMQMLANSTIRMTEALLKLSTSLGVFEAIGAAFEGWGHIFKGIESVIDKINPPKKDEGKKSLWQKIKSADLLDNSESGYLAVRERKMMKDAEEKALSKSMALHESTRLQKGVDNYSKGISNTFNTNIYGVKNGEDAARRMKPMVQEAVNSSPVRARTK